jgi:hypothetical protein
VHIRIQTLGWSSIEERAREPEQAACFLHTLAGTASGLIPVYHSQTTENLLRLKALTFLAIFHPPYYKIGIIDSG